MAAKKDSKGSAGKKTLDKTALKRVKGGSAANLQKVSVKIVPVADTNLKAL